MHLAWSSTSVCNAAEEQLQGLALKPNLSSADFAFGATQKPSCTCTIPCPSTAESPAISICPLHVQQRCLVGLCRRGSPGTAGPGTTWHKDRGDAQARGIQMQHAGLCSDRVFITHPDHRMEKSQGYFLKGTSSVLHHGHRLSWHISWTSRLGRKTMRRLKKTRWGRALRMSYKCNVRTQGCLSMGPKHSGWRIRNT